MSYTEQLKLTRANLFPSEESPQSPLAQLVTLNTLLADIKSVTTSIVADNANTIQTPEQADSTKEAADAISDTLKQLEAVRQEVLTDPQLEVSRNQFCQAVNETYVALAKIVLHDKNQVTEDNMTVFLAATEKLIKAIKQLETEMSLQVAAPSESSLARPEETPPRWYGLHKMKDLLAQFGPKAINTSRVTVELLETLEAVVDDLQTNVANEFYSGPSLSQHKESTPERQLPFTLKKEFTPQGDALLVTVQGEPYTQVTVAAEFQLPHHAHVGGRASGRVDLTGKAVLRIPITPYGDLSTKETDGRPAFITSYQTIIESYVLPDLNQLKVGTPATPEPTQITEPPKKEKIKGLPIDFGHKPRPARLISELDPDRAARFEQLRSTRPAVIKVLEVDPNHPELNLNPDVGIQLSSSGKEFTITIKGPAGTKVAVTSVFCREQHQETRVEHKAVITQDGQAQVNFAIPLSFTSWESVTVRKAEARQAEPIELSSSSKPVVLKPDVVTKV